MMSDNIACGSMKRYDYAVWYSGVYELQNR